MRAIRPYSQILSRADYNLKDFTVEQNYTTAQTCATTATCPSGTNPEQVLQTSGSNSGKAVCECVGSSGTGVTCSQASPPAGYVSPTTPGGWSTPPPLDGNFVWITPLVGPDGFLYLFGTGQYRASPVYLARLPMSYQGQDFPNFLVGQYLASTPGLQFFNTNSGTFWDSNPANATPLTFDVVGANANLGEISVRYFNDVGAYLMSYSHPSGSGGGSQVIVRWATSVTSTWHELIALDMTNQRNQCQYCSNANATTCSSSYGITVPSPQAFTQCYPDSVYAPDMLPYLTNVSRTVVGSQPVLNFTLSYLWSTFVPYDSVLFSADVQAVNPNLIFANGFD